MIPLLRHIPRKRNDLRKKKKLFFSFRKNSLLNDLTSQKADLEASINSF